MFKLKLPDVCTERCLCLHCFNCFSNVYNILQVNQDGLISVEDLLGGINTPVMFPTVVTSTPLMAVFWADVNTTANDGRVYYRQRTTAGQRTCLMPLTDIGETCTRHLCKFLASNFDPSSCKLLSKKLSPCAE